MMQFIYWYLSVGFALWLVFAFHDMLNGFELLRNATAIEILRGSLVILAWPILPWMLS